MTARAACLPPDRHSHGRAFTLIELLIVISIVAVLATLIAIMAPKMRDQGQMAKSLGNLRQIGTAVQSYANDNDFRLPNRTEDATNLKWPALLVQYLGDDPTVYADPADPGNYLKNSENPDPLDNSRNQTSYILNGFNDAGAYEDSSVSVKLNSMDKPSQTILMACQFGNYNFYMDFREGNHTSGVLNKRVYGNSAPYLFADGSVRMLDADKTYKDEYWLVWKDGGIPSLD